MNNRRVIVITLVSGILFVVLFYNFLHEGLAVAFAIVAILIMGVGFATARAMNKTDSFVEQLGEADILNRMWFPLQDELTVVVKTGGRVTEATSAWSTAPGLSKRETPRTFFTGMQRYVRNRELVASLAGSDLATEESRQQLVAEQQNLMHRAQELLEEVNRAIKAIPGYEKVVRRPRSARPSPAAQRTRATATMRSAGTRRPARSAQLQTATAARVIQERPAPSHPAPMRIADAPMTSERAVPTPTRREPEPPPAPSVPLPPPPPAPAPPRITYTPMQAPPPVAAAPPREPEPPPPPSVPPAPAPVTASVPKPAVAAPAPSEPEPAAKPSEPPVDLPLDVASVCDALFDPKMMSYEANRLFDDRYKDATVRWKGTARRSNVYSYDFEFGDGGGTKAELDVYEVKQQYGSRTVKAFVQLPTEAADDIGARIGEDVQVEGRLISCEGSARRLYVADARMVD